MTDTVLTLDQNDSSFFDTFLRSIYQSPALACIRELIHNAIDAHTESECKKKVDISFTDKFFYLRDYGEGISPQKLTNLLSVILRSGKRHEGSNATGGHGLGSKTVFGILYEDIKAERPMSEIFMISISDGMKYTYQLLVENGKPAYRLLQSIHTDEPSGLCYMIEMNSAMKNMRSESFLNIFSPVIDKLNFVDGLDFNEYIDNIEVGNYIVSILKYPKGSNVTPFSVSTEKVDSKYKLNLSDVYSRMCIQYKDMIYPMPDDYKYYDVDFVGHYVERYIQKLDDSYAYSTSEYLISLNIGNESFGMEATKPRDNLITESMTEQNLNDFKQYKGDSRLNEEHAHFDTSVVYSTFKRYLTYLSSTDVVLEVNPLITHCDVFKQPISIYDVFSFVCHYITSDDFIEHISNRHVRNLAQLQYNLCPLEQTFTVDDVLKVMTHGNVYSGKAFSQNNTISSDVITITLEIFQAIVDKCEIDYPDDYFDEMIVFPPSLLSSSGTCINNPQCKDLHKFPYRFVASFDGDGGHLTVNKILYYDTNDKQVKELSGLDYTTDACIIVYKDRKIDQRKIKQYIKENVGKYIIVIDRAKNKASKDNSKILNSTDIIKRTQNKLKMRMALLEYHKTNPIVLLSELLPTIKVDKPKKQKRSKYDLKVNDLSVTARSIELYCPNNGYTDHPTYEQIVYAIDNSDKVLCYNEVCSISREYFNELFAVEMRQSMYDGYVNVIFTNNMVRYSTRLTVNYRDEHISKICVIKLNGKPSNAIVEYLKNHPKVDDGIEWLKLKRELLEHNEFKSMDDMTRLTEERHYNISNLPPLDDFLKSHMIDYIKDKLTSILYKSTSNFPRMYGSYQDDALSEVSTVILKRHIGDTLQWDNQHYKSVSPERYNHIMLQNGVDEIQYFTDTILRYRKTVDTYIETCTKYDLVMINSLLSLLYDKVEDTVDEIIENFDKMYTI